MNKKVLAVMFLIVLGASLVSGVLVSNVSADENYNDISHYYGEEYGEGEIPEDGQARVEPRTRFKDV